MILFFSETSLKTKIKTAVEKINNTLKPLKDKASGLLRAFGKAGKRRRYKEPKTQSLRSAMIAYIGARKPLAFFLSALVVVVNSVLLVYCVEVIDRGGHDAAMIFFSAHLPVSLLTAAVAAAALVFLFNLTGRIVLSMALVDVPCIILPVISYFKYIVNGEPLSPQDFTMAGNLGELGGMTDGMITLTAPIARAIVVLFILFFIVWIFAPALRFRWNTRLIAGVASLSALLMVFSPASIKSFLPGFGIDTDVRKTQSTIYTENGFLLGLYRSAISTDSPAPEGYSEEYMNSIIERIKDFAAKTPASALKDGVENPNIILILSESFYDITSLPEVTFSSDPTPFYHYLCKDERAYHGKFYTRQVGYGTGNVEIEVLTGLSGRLFPASSALSYDLKSSDLQKIPALPAVLKNAGYYTAAIHTYSPTLYDRLKNFPAIGFDKSYFQEDLEAVRSYDYSSQYILSDDFLSRQIISEFEAHSGDGPVFIYGISMENHQPYTSRYGEQTITASSSLLSSSELELLSTYARGTSGADASFATLIDYFSKSEKPTVIAVFGDHLPSLPLSDTSSIYRKLGIIDSDNKERWTSEQNNYMFCTDCFVWSNYSLPREGESSENSSSNVFGRSLLAKAGFKETYFDAFLRMYSGEVALWNEYAFTDAKGNVFDNVPKEKKEYTDMYYAINYDTYFGEGYITEKLKEYVNP